MSRSCQHGSCSAILRQSSSLRSSLYGGSFPMSMSRSKTRPPTSRMSCCGASTNVAWRGSRPIYTAQAKLWDLELWQIGHDLPDCTDYPAIYPRLDCQGGPG